MKRPFLSVIIPAHNEERHIGLCLNALRANRGSFEVIVVNDGSSDKTREIAEKSGIVKKLVNFEEGHSASFARNAGSKHAKGGYLVFIDADQIVEKNFVYKLEKHLKQTNTDGSDFLVLSYKPETFIQKAWSAYRKAYQTMGFVHIVRTSVFMKLKFDEKIFYHEERDFRNRFDAAGLKYSGPVNAFVYHIDPEGVEEFTRQRKWQGRMAGIGYFIPCIIPPLILVPSIKVFIKSKDLKNSIRWLALDILGRYISLYHRLKNNKKI
ncbi:MAG: glycosyltransferase [Candidatus Aenigmarchaeota archaeon]|nr:glycosyltransferase [Candidatus Aenigmarchaeota archaeon]